jgi:hypothetical protein
MSPVSGLLLFLWIKRSDERDINGKKSFDFVVVVFIIYLRKISLSLADRDLSSARRSLNSPCVALDASRPCSLQ